MRGFETLKEFVRPYYLRWVYFPLFPGRRPAAFENCWRYPHGEVGAGQLPHSSAPAGLPDIIFFPMTDWHARIQRSQHLASAFAELGCRCLYVNPNLGRQFEDAPLRDLTPRWTRLEENIFEVHIRLRREPVFHHRLLTSDEIQTVVRTLETMLREMGSRRAVQIVSLPTWTEAALALREASAFPLVYDCHDLLSGFGNMAPEIVAAEANLLRDADLVLFSSADLAARLGQHRKWLLVRNAVTAEHFHAAVQDRPEAAVAGYAGSLSEWFDVDAIRASALRNPDCRFVLAGRIESPAVARLRDLSNVELTGEIPYVDLLRRYTSFRIGLIPFLRNELTMATNPIKLYEYFACGMPVVSTRLPEVESFGDLVYIASDPEEFASQVARALAEDDIQRRQKRIELARQESWISRADFLLKEFQRIQ